MYADVVLPNVGFGMEEGRLTAWLKAPGDPVRKGEAIAEVEGDKTTVELEAVVDGVLDTILVPVDRIVAVGTVLARIRTTSAVPEAAPAPPSSAPDTPSISPVAQRLAQERGIDLSAVRGTGPGGRIMREDVEALAAQRVPATNGGKALAAPAVRKLARDHGIDLRQLRGTGEGGRVTRTDVEIAIEKQKVAALAPAPLGATRASPLAAEPMPTPIDGERWEVPLSQMRQTIARRLTQSYQEAPHFDTTAQLDLTDALKALPKGIGINTLLLYTTIQALKDVPDVNATYEDGRLYQYAHVNLAIAVALPNGLLTPVLHRADDYSLTGLAERSKDLVNRARETKLKLEELSGGTFTISNLGVVEQIERFTAVINPPQVGILAVGAAKERPLVIDGGLHIRTTAYVTLCADHRIVDGMIAARFLEALDHRLQAFGK